MRELWDLWVEACLRPRKVFYYDRMRDIPIREIPSRQRALLGLASVNLEIASHPWRFETANLDTLIERGLSFDDATLQTIAACQGSYLLQSPAIRRFLTGHAGDFASEVEYVSIP